MISKYKLFIQSIKQYEDINEIVVVDYNDDDDDDDNNTSASISEIDNEKTTAYINLNYENDTNNTNWITNPYNFLSTLPNVNPPITPKPVLLPGTNTSLSNLTTIYDLHHISEYTISTPNDLLQFALVCTVWADIVLNAQNIWEYLFRRAYPLYSGDNLNNWKLLYQTRYIKHRTIVYGTITNTIPRRYTNYGLASLHMNNPLQCKTIQDDQHIIHPDDREKAQKVWHYAQQNIRTTRKCNDLLHPIENCTDTLCPGALEMLQNGRTKVSDYCPRCDNDVRVVRTLTEIDQNNNKQPIIYDPDDLWKRMGPRRGDAENALRRMMFL